MTDFRNFLEHLYQDAIESEGQARTREKSHMISAELAAAAALIHSVHKEQLYEALTLYDEKNIERSSASSVRCPVCIGTGWNDAADDACEACQGDGWVLEEPGRWPKCPDCDGTGWEADLIDAYAEMCTTCEGDGYLPPPPAVTGASVKPNRAEKILKRAQCNTCYGSGYANGTACPSCGGGFHQTEDSRTPSYICGICGGCTDPNHTGICVTCDCVKPNIMHTEDCTCHGGSGPCSCI